MINSIPLNFHEVYNFCIISSISNAIDSLKDDSLNYEHSWDNRNYNFQDSAGIRATFSFKNNKCVIAIQNTNNPNFKNEEELVHRMDKELINLAKEETLLYLLDTIEGETKPLVNFLLWSEGVDFFSNDKFEEMEDELYSIFGILNLNTDEVMSHYISYYEFNEFESNIVLDLYHKKLKETTSKMKIKLESITQLDHINEDCFQSSKDSLLELGFILER